MTTTRMTRLTLALLLVSLGVACSTTKTLSDEEAQTQASPAATQLTSQSLALDSGFDALLKTTQILDGVDGISDLTSIVESIGDCVSSDFGLTSVSLTFSSGCSVNGVAFAGKLEIDIDVFPSQQIKLKATGLSVDGNTLDGSVAIKGTVNSGSLTINLTLKLVNGTTIALENVKASVSALNMMAEISGTARVTQANGDSASITMSAVAHAGLGSYSSSGSASVEVVSGGAKTKGELTFSASSPGGAMVSVKLISIGGASVPPAFQCYSINLALASQPGYTPTPQTCPL